MPGDEFIPDLTAGSETKILVNEKHFALRQTLGLKHVDDHSPAKPLGAGAVIAAHFFRLSTGGLEIVTPGVHRTCNVAGPVNGGLQGRDNFIPSKDDIHLLWAK